MAVPLRNRYLDHATPFVAEWTSVSRLQSRKEAWRRLCDVAIDPNPFYAPEYLAASAAMDGRDIRCIAVYRDGSRDSDLIGLFPLQRASVFDGALIPALEFYRNDYVCLTAPLVDRDVPQAVWDCFFDRCVHSPGEPQVIMSRLHPAGEPGDDALQAVLKARGLAHCTIEAHRRAAIEKPDSFHSAFRKLSSSRRSDLGRRRRKLRTDGTSEMLSLRAGDPRIPAMVAAFLRIEAEGWKGKSGTAMACNPRTRAFAEAVFSSGDAEINALLFNGQPIVVDCMLRTQGVISTVKTAYDEAFSAYAPGLLACVHTIRQASEREDVTRIDSCAIENHVLNDLWPDRRPISWLGFATSDQLSASRLDQVVRLAQSAKRLKGWLREMLQRP
jgi:CelD/BcsL family acetyltransferase involved in cellulose biosynthesis